MEPFKVTVTPEQQAAMQERLVEALAPMTRAVAELNRIYQFGTSAEHPGLINSTNAAVTHMGGMLEQLRTLTADRVADLRAANLASAAASPQ